MTTRIITFLSLCIFTSFISVNAQSTSYEVGASFNGLAKIGAIFKMENQQGNYYRLSASHLRFASEIFTELSVQSSLNLQFGLEKRIPISENAAFYHGLSPGFGFTYSFFEEGSLGGSISLGYILGMMYDLNEKFYISLEVVPRLDVGLRERNGISGINFAAGANTSSTTITIAHRFQYSK